VSRTLGLVANASGEVERIRQELSIRPRVVMEIVGWKSSATAPWR
jgi:hypothetical protein